MLYFLWMHKETYLLYMCPTAQRAFLLRTADNIREDIKLNKIWWQDVMDLLIEDQFVVLRSKNSHVRLTWRGGMKKGKVCRSLLYLSHIFGWSPSDLWSSAATALTYTGGKCTHEHSHIYFRHLSPVGMWQRASAQ